jgi:hypothetical protein
MTILQVDQVFHKCSEEVNRVPKEKDQLSNRQDKPLIETSQLMKLMIKDSSIFKFSGISLKIQMSMPVIEQKN